jgi:hypothetical protein
MGAPQPDKENIGAIRSVATAKIVRSGTVAHFAIGDDRFSSSRLSKGAVLPFSAHSSAPLSHCLLHSKKPKNH